MKKNRSRPFFSFLATLFGALMMMLLVVLINKPVKQKEEKAKKESRYMDLKKSKKAPAKPKPKPKPKPKKSKSVPPAALPNLGSSLSGIDMGIPEFAVEDIGGDASSLLGDVGKDMIMSESTVDVKPKVASRTPIEYPKKAMKKNIKGYVLMNLLIAENGSVEIAQILESNPPEIFDSVAIRGIKGWKFSPAMYKGKPVKVWAKQKVRFDFN